MKNLVYILLLLLFISCKPRITSNLFSKQMTAKTILGNSNYQAICYGGYRFSSREKQPTLAEIKEDLKILFALNLKVIRTYNVHYDEIKTILKAIRELKKSDSTFEMYVMLGAWIDCKNAWTNLEPIHNEESDRNVLEINEAVKLTNDYPEIVKIISVGNEAMVKWATSYYVSPKIILNWVNHLQNLKKEHKLPKEVWITSSDNFASWGGHSSDYHVEDLNQLIHAVDYISLHTYPMHDTHYNPVFWGIKESESQFSDKEKVNAAMIRARNYAINQYESVVNYMMSIGVNKPVHIGETGWATKSNEHYGNDGSQATDEYKSGLFYTLMREWTINNNISCFYFEAFDENWKDASNTLGSENHFGLINLQAQVKHVFWKYVDNGTFRGLSRDGKPITKTYNGDEKALWLDVKIPHSILKN